MKQIITMSFLLIAFIGCVMFEQRPLTMNQNKEQMIYTIREIITIELKNPTPETHEWKIKHMDRTLLRVMNEPEVIKTKKGKPVTHFELETTAAGRTPLIIEYVPKGQSEAKPVDIFRLRILITYY